VESGSDDVEVSLPSREFGSGMLPEGVRPFTRGPTAEDRQMVSERVAASRKGLDRGPIPLPEQPDWPAAS
jgi:hypothetical protein